MSSLTAAVAPAPRGHPSSQFQIHDDGEGMQSTSPPTAHPPTSMKHNMNPNDGTVPLTSSKLGNLQARTGDRVCDRAVSGYKKLKLEHPTSVTKSDMSPDSMNDLLAKLSEQQILLEKQKNALTPASDQEVQGQNGDSSSSSVLLTPGTERFSVTESTDGNDDDETLKLDVEEMARLKKELDAAKDQIARQKQELDQTRGNIHTLGQATSSSSHRDLSVNNDAGERPLTTGVASFNGGGRPIGLRPEHWPMNEDARSDSSDAMSPSAFNTAQNMWSASTRPTFNTGASASVNQQFQPQGASWGQPGARPWGHRAAATTLPPLIVPQQQHMQQRIYSGPASPISSSDGRMMNEFSQFSNGGGIRRSNTQNSRSSSLYPQPRNNGWDLFPGGISPIDGANLGMNPTSAFQSMGLYPATMQYQPRPIGTPLSPTAEEFRTAQPSATPWNAAPPPSPGQTYVSPMEPLNYRRLLDRSVTCNWKYIVDKIVCNNDQQASIFLQQKLKVGTVEQKYEIIESIVAQAYPLMVNRFGNFLVQRCFEHGTPEQVIAIANAIRGNTLSLSMDAFGCHVVQKAFDAVPEDYKAIMVHELLRRIPETVIHRYACHVWQKLFELRWSDSPPQIMKYVNEALCGMWHDVALGETGSLVVQNIFENCLEEDKRPCINEVLSSIDIVAHGQFGNWCIQHICEHGLHSDRSRAIDHVLRYATEYSMDQFASKVVEKCLKIGGADFLERYLERVCEGRADRPRIPLIDIASDQYGNYLIQYILTHANPNHRDIVASHIRKHMVSLRGSKFGSRVGMLCCNPAYATHPGPGVGLPTNRFSGTHNSNSRFGGAYR
ncbi:hypothetical protein MMC29_002056 [Sticta canariensis]|nr:hypothetical protein [Sticta canariensis]